MTERPILFSAPMIKALLAGAKTQTRRAVKGSPVEVIRLMNKVKALDGYDEPTGDYGICSTHSRVIDKHVKCPFGAPGDTLWVRETHAIVPRTAYRGSEGAQQTRKPGCDHDAAVYREGWERSRPGRWRPSIHMPRWASRTTLEVMEVRVQRLNEISEQDAEQEGAVVGLHDYDCHGQGNYECDCGSRSYRDVFEKLWRSINGPDSWDANPWVWAISFRVIKPSVAAELRRTA